MLNTSSSKRFSACRNAFQGLEVHKRPVWRASNGLLVNLRRPLLTKGLRPKDRQVNGCELGDCLNLQVVRRRLHRLGYVLLLDH